MNFVMRNAMMILTGIIGSERAAIFSLGTPNSINLRLVMSSAAEKVNSLVKRSKIITGIMGSRMMFHRVL